MKNFLLIGVLIFCSINTFAYTTRLSALKEMQEEDDKEEQKNKGNENNPRQPVLLDELDCDGVEQILQEKLPKLIGSNVKFLETKQPCACKFGEKNKRTKEQSWSANLLLVPDIYRGIRNVSLIISVLDKNGANIADTLVNFIGGEICGIMDSVLTVKIQRDLDAKLKQAADDGIDILKCPLLELKSEQKAKGYKITKTRKTSDGMLRKMELVISR